MLTSFWVQTCTFFYMMLSLKRFNKTPQPILLYILFDSVKRINSTGGLRGWEIMHSWERADNIKTNAIIAAKFHQLISTSAKIPYVHIHSRYIISFLSLSWRFQFLLYFCNFVVCNQNLFFKVKIVVVVLHWKYGASQIKR